MPTEMPTDVAPEVPQDTPDAPRDADDMDPVLAESLVEEVSIDGMCGVY